MVEVLRTAVLILLLGLVSQLVPALLAMAPLQWAPFATEDDFHLRRRSVICSIDPQCAVGPRVPLRLCSAVRDKFSSVSFDNYTRLLI